MSTPDTDGKKVPPFTSFRLAPAIQKADSCCCEEHCASSAPVSTAVAGTRYTWKISGMDCAACARKVENAVRQIRGVNQAQVLFATEKLVVDADTDLRAQIERTVQKAGYTLRSEDSRDAAPESRLKENLPLITLIIMMAISWGLEQFNHPFGQLAFIVTTLVGLYPIARQALRLMKSGSWFAIETLMSVAAIGALFIGATAYGKRSLLIPCDRAILSKSPPGGVYPPTVNWFPVSPALMKARSPASLSQWSAQRATKSRQARPALTVSSPWRCYLNLAPARLTVS